MEDSIHHRQLRLQLVSHLKNKGILDPHVLEAFNKVPRHLFSDQAISAHEAYEDKPLEDGPKKSVAQPYVVAYQSTLLNVKMGEKILEIGTGSGYQSAILFELGAELFTVEQNKETYHTVKQRLNELGYSQIHMFYAEENEGLRSLAPYDKIIVNSPGIGITEKLIEQLKVGGVLVIPVHGDLQKILRILKISDLETRSELFEELFVVPLMKK